MAPEDPVATPDKGDFDRLELELRKLPDVVAVGFEGPMVGSPVTDDGIVTVHVLVDGEVSPSLEEQALDLGRLHLGRSLRIVVSPEGVERAGSAVSSVSEHAMAMVSPTRARLIGVELAEGGRAVEVTLAHGDRTFSARAAGGSPSGAAAATLGALRQLGWSVPFELESAVRLAVGATSAVLVELVGPGGERLGISVGDTAERAAAKATLQALNRWLDDPGRRPMSLRESAPPA